MTEHYRLEELDQETRDYLALVRDQKGNGLPGIYIGQTDLVPILGFTLGFVVLIVVAAITLPPTDPPAKEAMLQTAGIMLGGWMILAAFRAWSAAKAGRYAGQFVYADADHLYQANGSGVAITDLDGLREARAVQNFNEGKYQNTSITLKLVGARREVKVHDEEAGRRLTVFLSALAYMRAGGENGEEQHLTKLSPEAMGVVGKVVAASGEFPKDPERAEEGNAIRVPQPRREHRASSGVLSMALVLLVGTAVFLGLLTVNYPFRDEAVFAQIKGLSDKDQPPALRLYLANDKFTAHRDEAQQLLAARYEAGVRANVKGTDRALAQGMGDVVLALKDKPTPALSLRAVEDGPPPGMEGGTAYRQKTVGDKLADKWGVTIGDELVVFAMLEDPELPANIDLRWRFTDRGDIAYTVTLRRSPDEEPVVTRTGTIDSKADPNRTAEALADQVLALTVGEPKVRPVLVVPPEDF